MAMEIEVHVEFITAKKVAEIFGIHPSHARRMLKNGDIKSAKKIGNQWVVEEKEVIKFQYTKWAHKNK
jgi:predicted site-specific integrase-resolvase